EGPAHAEVSGHTKIVGVATDDVPEAGEAQSLADFLRCVAALLNLDIRPAPDAVQQAEHRDAAASQAAAKVVTRPGDRQEMILANQREGFSPGGLLGPLQYHVKGEGRAPLQDRAGWAEPGPPPRGTKK